MQNSEEYDIKIADYFDNKMTASEEEGFMEELGTNAPLRERYEDELAIRAILGNSIENEDVAVDDDLVYMHTAIEPTTHTTSVVPLYKRYKIVAAGLILVIGVSAVFVVFKNQWNNTNTAAITPAGGSAAPKVGTPQNITQPPTPGITAANAFAQYYKPYNSGSDPVEVSIYYQDYKQGRYSDVFAASDADLQVMGVDDNKEQLNQYLQLYKGLAYLAESKPTKAQQQFEMVLKTAHTNNPQYFEAQWYSCMAFLKDGDVAKAGLLAKAIAQSASSPYKAKAGELVAGLGVK